MKKSILGIMSLIMVISAFTSCGNTAKNANSKPKVKVNTSVITDAGADVTTTTTTEVVTTTITETSTETMTESVAEKIDSESKKNEISDYSFGAYNILENTQSKANVWFRKNISWITECTYSDPYYSNVEHMVYKADSNNLKLFGVNCGWAEISSRTTDDYVYDITFHFSYLDYDHYKKYNTGVHDRKQAECDLAYKTMYEKLVDAYGEPTEVYEENDWAKYSCLWEDTNDGDIFAWDSKDENGNGEAGLSFTVADFDFSTRISR